MDVEYLKKVRAEEREQTDLFSNAVPHYYFEIAHLLLTECANEFPNHQQVKSALEDIYELRKDKLMRTLKAIEPETPVKYVSNAGSVELNSVRPVF